MNPVEPTEANMAWQAVGRHRDAMIWVREARSGWSLTAVTSVPDLEEDRPVLAPPSDEMVLPAGFESQATAVQAAKEYLDREHDRRVLQPSAPGAVEKGLGTNREAEKRQFARVPVSLPVVGRAPQFKEMALRGMARSAGAGGMMVELPVEVVPGSTLRVFLETKRGPVEMEGKVVWTAAAKGATRHGLTFREPKGLSFIEDLVAGKIR